MCDICGKDIDTGAHTVLVYNTGKATIRLHFHHPCIFETDEKGNVLYEVFKKEVDLSQKPELKP